MIRKLACVALLVSAWSAAEAAGSRTYNTIAEGIDSATGQGLSGLNHGTFAGTYQDYAFIIKNSAAKTLQHSFDYRGGAVDSAALYFKEAPVIVTIRKGDFCAVVQVRRVVVGAGGFLDEAGSKFSLISDHDQCPSNRPELASAAAGLFRLPIAANNFFHGDWFKWTGTLKKCGASCAGAPPAPIGSFFKNVVFTPLDGKPGFTATLAENTSVDLGRGDFLRVGPAAKVSFNYVAIDLADKSTTARLRELTLPLNAGRLSNDALTLFMEPGSGFKAANLNIEAASGRVDITDGFVSGSVASESTVTLANGPGVRPSLITLARAEVALNGINLSIAGDKVTFSATNGTFSASIKDADLQLGRAVRLALGAADLKLSFACPTGAPDSCRPIQVSPNNPVITVGVISPLTLVTKGGTYDLGGAGSIKLDRGEVSTGALDLDSRRTKAPVVGNIIRVQLNVSAQTIQLYPGFQLEALSGALSGQDLALSPQDGLPAGDLALAVDIGAFRGEGIGRIATVRGKAAMSAVLRRAPQTDIHVLDGKIQADIVATTDGGGANASVLVTDLDLIHGDGSAIFNLTIPQLNYSRFIPGMKTEEGFPGGHVEVIVHEQTVSAKLTAAVKLEQRRVKIRGGKWSIEATTVPVQALLSISSPELVYAPVKIDFPPSTLCTSKVNLPFSNYAAAFNVTVVLQDNRLGLKSSPFQISPYPRPELDGAACRRAITLVCGIAGAALGPIGAIGGAYLCNQEIGKGEEKLQENMNSIVADGIRSIRFDVTP
ncbi:MAG: hypothetical protein PS018_23255 [bacterium]|nr:hypothetical protein [bacterium]